MKSEMYMAIKGIFSDYFDGENKEGVFVTIDGQQYSIKITAKKSPVYFNGQNATENRAAPSLETSLLSEEDRLQIINIFEGSVDHV